jgi:hypothetical protein
MSWLDAATELFGATSLPIMPALDFPSGLQIASCLNESIMTLRQAEEAFSNSSSSAPPSHSTRDSSFAPIRVLWLEEAQLGLFENLEEKWAKNEEESMKNESSSSGEHSNSRQGRQYSNAYGGAGLGQYGQQYYRNGGGGLGGLLSTAASEIKERIDRIGGAGRSGQYYGYGSMPAASSSGGYGCGCGCCGNQSDLLLGLLALAAVAAILLLNNNRRRKRGMPAGCVFTGMR